ncbi:hypothetical protein PPERSA_12395 [Pseudocohnilembus persalinus]|uniref:EF-hand domain-containing protein n=1 Tax=Pseudocohnilembus persalinus TaxID=266149 RepID=A0A0V0QP52_PSEPJ|nr:hypothetical protein PPERSA_12395 [Pseudocohnilembus persalinus]|eukprot:KRX03948.1 hypothetical protein PPERSA_12395 [Pseudocohnilembus persalinus]
MASLRARQQSPVKNYEKNTNDYYQGQSQLGLFMNFQRRMIDQGCEATLLFAINLSQHANEQRQVNLESFLIVLKQAGEIHSIEEQEEIFRYFDRQNKGYINLDEFLQALRGPLPSSRQNLIKRVFQQLDTDKDQIILIQSLKDNYIAKSHPDVRIGKKSEKDVLKQFIRQVDIFSQYMNIQDGQISESEFFEFFAFISASIKNENFFELYMKACFNLQDSNLYRQEMPYQAFGSPNYKAYQYQDQFNRQQQQQQDNISVSNRSVVSSNSQLNPSQLDNLSQGNNNNQINLFNPQQNQQIKPESTIEQPDFDQVSQRSVKSAISQQRSQVSQQRSQVSQQYQQDQQSQRSQQRSQQSNRSRQSAQQDQKAFQLLYQMRQKLASRGVIGFLGIQRQLRIMDDDFDQKVNFQEFKKALRDFKISFSDEDLLILFKAIDTDGSGFLDIDELVRGIKGPMSASRKLIVEKAFKKLDKDNDGIITVNDVKGVYSARYHPDLKKGLKSEDESTRDQRVTLDEFIEYYTNVSANIDDDEHFNAIINNGFKLGSFNQQYEAFSSSPDINRQTQNLYQKSNKIDTRSQITRNAPFGTSDSPVDYSTSLRPQSAQQQVYSNLQQGDLYKQNPSRQQGTGKYIPAGVPTWNGFRWVSQTNANQQNLTTAQDLINNLKSKLRARGAKGVFSLHKQLRAYDQVNSGQITYKDFKEVLENLRLSSPENQDFQIFTHFDKELRGQINYLDFLRYIRGSMNSNRRELVKLAFNRLSQNGISQISQLKQTFRGQKNPDVLLGKKTEDEVVGEFLDDFELHHQLWEGIKQKQSQQTVDWDEFCDYYEAISIGVDDDRYFENLVRNSWGLESTEKVNRFQNQY